jgi:vacuolar-type H+-ATPase subunit H
MTPEKSILQKIREKELEIGVKIDQSRRDADQLQETAKKAASMILVQADEEGRAIAGEFYQKEIEKVRNEVKSLESYTGEEVKAVREKGERNLPQAVDRIVSIVLSE